MSFAEQLAHEIFELHARVKQAESSLSAAAQSVKEQRVARTRAEVEGLEARLRAESAEAQIAALNIYIERLVERNNRLATNAIAALRTYCRQGGLLSF